MSLVSTGCVSGQGEELVWCPADLTATLAGDSGLSAGMDPKVVLDDAKLWGSSSASPVPHVPCQAMLLLSCLSAPGAAQQPKEQAVTVGTGILLWVV